MNIPTIEAIQTNNFDIYQLEDLLKKLHVGTRPLYIDLLKFSRFDVVRIITNLEIVMKKLGISAKIPYPFYIITKEKVSSHFFPLLADANQIPSLFKKLYRKPTKRELSMIKKLGITAEKIIDNNITQTLDSIKEIAKDNKLLHHLTREAVFYDGVLKKLKNWHESKRQ